MVFGPNLLIFSCRPVRVFVCSSPRPLTVIFITYMEYFKYRDVETSETAEQTIGNRVKMPTPEQVQTLLIITKTTML